MEYRWVHCKTFCSRENLLLVNGVCICEQVPCQNPRNPCETYESVQDKKHLHLSMDGISNSSVLTFGRNVLKGGVTVHQLPERFSGAHFSPPEANAKKKIYKTNTEFALLPPCSIDQDVGF